MAPTGCGPDTGRVRDEARQFPSPSRATQAITWPAAGMIALLVAGTVAIARLSAPVVDCRRRSPGRPWRALQPFP
jgi:hypothetical protein